MSDQSENEFDNLKTILLSDNQDVAFKHYVESDPNPSLNEILLYAAKTNNLTAVNALLEYQSAYFLKKIEDLKDRLNKNFEKDAMPSALDKYLTSFELAEIYRVFKLSWLEHKIEQALKKGKPFRLSKEVSGFARTINFVFDPETDDIALILETKSKRKGFNSRGKPKKDTFDTEKHSGSFKTAKPAARIDTDTPIFYANATLYGKSQAAIQEALDESAVAAQVAKSSSTETFLNQTTTGEDIQKSGIRPFNNKPYDFKKSVYSKWAKKGSLERFLRTPESHKLTSKQIQTLAAQLLTSVEAMHKVGKIHQDIKPDNILIFEDGQGNYRLELADFGLTFDPKMPWKNANSSATLGYDSPEISAINRDSSYKDYYFDPDFQSYGRELGETIPIPDPDYSKPNAANDMWAVGVTLHELYKHSLPTKHSVNQLNNFSSPIIEVIKGLLDKDRNTRLTATQGLALLPGVPKLRLKDKNILSLHTTDKHGNTALMLAVINKSILIIQALLNHEAEINAKNQDGKTALMLAAVLGQAETVEKLLDKKADIGVKDSKGDTAFTLAIKHFQPTVISVFTQRYPDLALNTLHSLAAQQIIDPINDTTLFTELLNHIPNNSDLVPILRSAAVGGHHQFVNALITAGANVNEKDENGKTALMLAQKRNHVLVVKAFHDAEIKAFILAAEQGNLESVTTLWDKIKDYDLNYIDATGDNGMTALMEAAKNGHAPIVEFLIKNLADLDVTDPVGETALTLSEKNNHMEIAQILRKTAFLMAVTQGNLEKVKMLCAQIKKSAQKTVDLRDGTGCTALMLAAELGHKEVVAFLIQQGANVNAIVETHNAQDQLSVLMMASTAEIAQLLIDAGANIHYKQPITRYTALEIQGSKKHQNAELIKVLSSAKTAENKIAFNASWDSFEKLEQKYVQEGKSKDHKVSVLFKHNKPKIDSEVRIAQFRLLEKAIKEMSKIPNDNEILNVFKTIGYLQAEIKAEKNHLPTRIEKVLTILESDLNNIKFIKIESIYNAKQEGAKQFASEPKNQKKQGKTGPN